MEPFPPEQFAFVKELVVGDCRTVIVAVCVNIPSVQPVPAARIENTLEEALKCDIGIVRVKSDPVPIAETVGLSG